MTNAFGRHWIGIFAAGLIAGSGHSALALSSAVNISTRMMIGSGDNVLIAGFIVNGTGQKKICVRGIGPSLSIAGAISDPTIELHDRSGAIVAQNDNWRSTQQDALIAAQLNPKDDREAALIATVNAGQSYTVVVQGINGATGVGLVEIYDLEGGNQAARLANISTRGNVLTGDNVMIAGFIVQGDSPKRMITRARGPSLYLNGIPIPGAIVDPELELHDGNGALIAQNDNWRSSQSDEINASGLAPSDDREPALIATLQPGAYTAVVKGVNNTTGVVLVEAYDMDQPPQSDGSTLYIAQLQGNIPGASGSGVATLRVAADGKSAVFTMRYSNLTSAITGMHIHGPADPGKDGGILYDVDAATPQPDGSYVWVFTQVGTTTVADILRAIADGRTYFNIHTTQNPKGEIRGTFTLSAGGQVAPSPTPPPPLASGTPSAEDAARFLTQATFGTTATEIAKVQQIGFDAWLNQQFTAPVSAHVPFVDRTTSSPKTITDTMTAWWTYALTAPDQLRQRVAFALSEILVVSTQSAGLGDEPIGMSTYVDTLVNGGFGNFRQLLENVTLNPAMGAYLNMLKNNAVDPTGTEHPNENFAREIMQLFSIGLYRLNLDGGLTLDSGGSPIATYNQGAVSGQASVFTGWTFQNSGRLFYDAPDNFRQPMMALAEHHQPEAKTILNGAVIPAGQTPDQDLKGTLDTIFNHPNVGPFICRLLIQRLVTSNPSRGYIYRVSSVFNDNGRGVRGDLQAVVRAILMDYDARGPAKTGIGSGKEREPVLRMTELLRAFKASSPTGTFYVPLPDVFGQEPLHSPTVFNFFSADYAVPGAIARNGLKSPEFQITTETTIAEQANTIYAALYDQDYPLDLSIQQALANDPAALTDSLNVLLLNGNMSSDMRTVIIDTVSQIPATDINERVQSAVYLVLTSAEYVIEK